MANKQQVIALNKAHPTWTSADIVDHLGCQSAYVRATATRNNLRLGVARSRKAISDRVSVLIAEGLCKRFDAATTSLVLAVIAEVNTAHKSETEA
jgi:hypothetical protein